MGKGIVIVFAAVLLVVCGVLSDCAHARATRSGAPHHVG